MVFSVSGVPWILFYIKSRTTRRVRNYSTRWSIFCSIPFFISQFSKKYSILTMFEHNVVIFSQRVILSNESKLCRTIVITTIVDRKSFSYWTRISIFNQYGISHDKHRNEIDINKFETFTNKLRSRLRAKPLMFLRRPCLIKALGSPFHLLRAWIQC